MLTDEMRENLTGLDRPFTEKEPAFRHDGMMERVGECLDDYHSANDLRATAQ